MTPAAALARIEDMCARSEMCSHEVRVKLTGWGMVSELTEKIIRHLRVHKYIDDARFADAFVRDKVVFNHWGRIKVKQALRFKKIDNSLIDKALDIIDDDEYLAALVDVVRSKAMSLRPPYDFEKRHKILRHAVSRGFEPQLIIDVIKQPELWE